MFNAESWPTLRRVGRQLWRVGRRFYNARTHTPIVEELELESAFELFDYSYVSADSKANPPKIGVWVRALRIDYGDQRLF